MFALAVTVLVVIVVCVAASVAAHVTLIARQIGFPISNFFMICIFRITLYFQYHFDWQTFHLYLPLSSLPPLLASNHQIGSILAAVSVLTPLDDSILTCFYSELPLIQANINP